MRFLLRAFLLVLVIACPVRAQQPSAPPADEHQHHHHESAPAPTTGEEGSPQQLDMEGRPPSKPDSPEVVELKARFSTDYMLKAGQRRQVFESYLDTLGAQGILDVLEARSPLCHNEAHELGRAVYAHFKDVGRALSECGSRCTSACLHGVLKEAYGNSTVEQLRPQLASVCTQGAMAEIKRPGNCAHGMGHALMMVAGNDVDQSIDGCAGFNNPAMEYYCVTGVFMELFDQAAQWKDKGTFYPCDIYTRFPAACYRYQSNRMLNKVGRDRAKLAELCRSLPAAQRRGCFHGAGFAALLEVTKQPELIATACPDQPAEDQTLCLEGLVESFAAYESDKAAASCSYLKGQAAETCQAAAREGTYRLNKPSLPLYLGKDR